MFLGSELRTAKKGAKNKMEEIKLDIKIDLEIGEVWICEKGTYNACGYFISSINEVGECIEDYIKSYCKD